MGTTGLVLGLMTPWDANSPPLSPKDWLFWEKAYGRLITAEKWMPLVQVGDRHGVTGLWERWVWAEAMPEAGRQRGRNYEALVPTTTSPPIASSGTRARQAAWEHPGPLLPTGTFPWGGSHPR